MTSGNQGGGKVTAPEFIATDPNRRDTIALQLWPVKQRIAVHIWNGTDAGIFLLDRQRACEFGDHLDRLIKELPITQGCQEPTDG